MSVAGWKTSTFPLQTPLTKLPVTSGEMATGDMGPPRIVSREKPLKDRMAIPPGKPVTEPQLTVFNRVRPSESYKLQVTEDGEVNSTASLYQWPKIQVWLTVAMLL